MAGRVLAVLAAIGMIGGAFVYRYGVPGGGGGSGGNGDGAAAGAIVCASELGPVCDAIEGAVVERAGETADRLIAARGAADADVAGWLAPGPWAAMVDEARALASKAALFEDEPTGLASTPIVAVARAGQIPPACSEGVTWRCLGDAAQGGDFRVGGDAAGTPGGLFLRAAALSGFFGGSDWAINDLDANPEGQTWFANLNTRLNAAAGFGASSLNRFVLVQGSANVFLTLGSSAAALSDNPAFEIRTPAPKTTIAATYTAAARDGTGIDGDEVGDALGANGWTVQPNAKTEGLPSPGVLLALREGS